MALMETLLDIQVPDCIRISPNSRQILYSTTAACGNRTGEYDTSSLWLAETGYGGSARRLTNGNFNDRHPSWDPDGKSIVFVSDRAKAGEQWALYRLFLEGSDEQEPIALTPVTNERNIEKHVFSPDGRRIAYLSADEKTERQRMREKEKDDAKVWGEELAFNRLRLLDMETGKVEVLVELEAHVVDFAWSDDGSGIAFVVNRATDIESKYLHGTTVNTVDLSTRTITKLCDFPSKLDDLQWAGSNLYAISYVDPGTTVAANCVYTISLSPPESIWTYYAYGKENCAFALGKADRDVTVSVQNGMDDEIRLLDGPTIFSSKVKAILASDAGFTTDSDEMIIAVAVGDINRPVEVYSVTASGGSMVKLSNHGEPLNGRHFGQTEVIRCESADSKEELEALWIAPASQLPEVGATEGAKPRDPVPTFVFPHGGPYHRISETFDPTYHMWAQPLLEAGYAMLLPYYRGGSSHGHSFASYARGAVGTVEYEDIILLTTHAISMRYADPQRLAIGGWSQGGFLAFLFSVRNGQHGQGWKFRAAIAGAGVSDWDTMTLTSDVGATLEADLAGLAPWKTGKSDTSNRRGSAIWEFHTAVETGAEIPPVLILHGEKDVRVPLEQGVGMRRALESKRLPVEMVVYPREEHLFKERRHLVDMAGRVVDFMEKHVGPGKSSVKPI